MDLIWLDLETTGLDPLKNSILEVAVSKAELNDPFRVVALYETVISLPPTEAATLSPYIIDMHTKNGLLADCAAWNAKSRETVDEELAGLVPYLESREDRPVLAGSSIHFDLSFIRVHLPLLYRRLSHRLYDVSAIKLFCQSIGMEKLPKAEAHRAAADVLESIDHARRCVRWLDSRR